MERTKIYCKDCGEELESPYFLRTHTPMLTWCKGCAYNRTAAYRRAMARQRIKFLATLGAR